MEMQANGIREEHEKAIWAIEARQAEAQKQREEFAAKQRALKPEPPAAEPAPPPPAQVAPPPELVALIRQIANEVAVTAIRDHNQQAVAPPQTMPAPMMAPPMAWPAHAPMAWPPVQPAGAPLYNPHSRRW